MMGKGPMGPGPMGPGPMGGGMLPGQPPPPPGAPPVTGNLGGGGGFGGHSGLGGLGGLGSLMREMGSAGHQRDMQGWSEHQNQDGRRFYHHAEDGVSQWEKPACLKTPEEAKLTDWEEYRIWNGREFFFNKKTRVSCWVVPKAVKRARGAQVDIGPELVEKHAAFLQMLDEVGVDQDSHWNKVLQRIKDDRRYLAIESVPRKRQLFAQKVSDAWTARVAEERKQEHDRLSAYLDWLEENCPRTWETVND